jgi:hypothetical protein
MPNPDERRSRRSIRFKTKEISFEIDYEVIYIILLVFTQVLIK